MRKSTKKTIDAELREVLVAGKVEADNPDAGARARRAWTRTRSAPTCARWHGRIC